MLSNCLMADEILVQLAEDVQPQEVVEQQFILPFGFETEAWLAVKLELMSAPSGISTGPVTQSPHPVLTIIPPSVVRRLIPRISNSTPKPGGEIYAHSIPRKSKALAPRLGHPSNSLNSFHHSTNLATHHSLKDASHCCDQEPGDSSLLKKPSNGVTEAVLTFLLQFVQSPIVPVATLSGCPTCPPGNIESLA